MTANLNQTPATLEKLYDRDYYLWIKTTIDQIKDRDFNLVDWDNLLEELESLVKSDKRELENRLTVLVEHLLKLAYWEAERENNARCWRNTIKEQRRQIGKLFKYSPSLKTFLEESFAECYADARIDAADSSGLPVDIFPEESPFTLEETLNPARLPERTN